MGGRSGGRLRARVQVSRYGRWPCNNNMELRRQKDIIICFWELEQFNCNCMDNCGQPSSARKKKKRIVPSAVRDCDQAGLGVKPILRRVNEPTARRSSGQLMSSLTQPYHMTSRVT